MNTKAPLQGTLSDHLGCEGSGALNSCRRGGKQHIACCEVPVQDVVVVDMVETGGDVSGRLQDDHHLGDALVLQGSILQLLVEEAHLQTILHSN